MKQLKWFIALVALLVVPLGLETAPALAGNCTSAYANNPYYKSSIYGTPAFTGVVGNCTNVTKVRFSWPGVGGLAQAFISGNNPANNYYTNIVWSSHPGGLSNELDPNIDGYAWEEYGAFGPCAGSNTLWAGAFAYQIQSIDIHGIRTWGGPHFVAGAWGADQACFQG